MRRWGCGWVGVVALAAVLSAATPATADSAATTTSSPPPATTTTSLPDPGTASVTIEAGPTRPTGLFEPCDDVGQLDDAATAFIISRMEAGPELVVGYEATGGDAVAGDDYRALPGTVVIPEGASSVVLSVRPLRSTDRSHWAHLTLALLPGPGYDVGANGSASIAFTVERDPSLPPVDCLPAFQLLDDPLNHEQTIHVGEALAPLRATIEPVSLRLRSGALPEGIEVAPQFERTTQFVGRATRPGDFVAELSACLTGDPVVTCRSTTLTVHVLPAPTTGVEGDSELPATGTMSGGLFVFALLMLSLGGGLTFRYGVRAAR